VVHFVGVAPTFSSTDTSVASFDKSSHYASPEQLTNGKVDFRSEIYSLGATMWFLLTGAPPLIARQGPLAMQPTTIGLAVDKLTGMPKRVRRLLAQMLSADPEARPQDPLAFYRQIEECLAQVDRRESMARRFGVPLPGNPASVASPGRRRFPAKALALAAMLLLIAAVAAVMVPSYLRHERVRQAEEPIGVPVGVPEPVASAASVTVNAPPAETSQASTDLSVASANTSEKAQPQPDQPATTVQTAQTSSIETRKPKIENAEAIKPLPTAPEQTAPATVAEQNQPPPASNSNPVAAPKQVAVAPVPPPVPAAPNSEPVPPKEVTAASVQPSIAPPADVAPANAPAEVAVAPVQPPVSSPPAGPPLEKRPLIAKNDVAAKRQESSVPEPAESVRPKVSEAQSNRGPEVASALPTARPVSPEVRKAEPAPPGEGPDEIVAQPEQEAAPVVTKSVRSENRTEKPRAKTERTAKPKRPSEPNATTRIRVAEENEEREAPIPRSPDGKLRARFIGVTPEGDWMFALPSRKIVILPPPPGG
jgi:hypothetical protein